MASLIAIAIYSSRFLLDLERAKKGVRRSLLYTTLSQVGLLAYLGFNDDARTFYMVAITFNILALCLLYYPRTTFWLKQQRESQSGET